MPSPPLRIAAAQLDAAVADIDANVATIRAARAEAARADAHLLVCPELALTGSPLFDLGADPGLIARAAAALDDLRADTVDGGPAVLVGLPWQERPSDRPCNGVALLAQGHLVGWRAKVVPSWLDGFDEPRSFAPGPVPGPLALPHGEDAPIRLGVLVGSDLATPDAAEALAETGAEILVAPSAVAFDPDRFELRQQQAVQRIAETGLPLIQVNRWGAQGGIVFDGASFALDARRHLAALAPAFKPALQVTEWERDEEGWLVAVAVAERRAPLGREEALWRAAVLGLRAHVEKNGWQGVQVELEESLAAALTLLLAVDALGTSWVSVLHPSERPLGPVADLAAKLAIEQRVVDLAPLIASQHQLLAPMSPGRPLDPELRHTLLAAVARQDRRMLLSTTTKSDLALGTVPAAGDLAPLGDLWASALLDLARWRLREERDKAMLRLVEAPLAGDHDRTLAAIVERKSLPLADRALHDLERQLLEAEPLRRRAPLVIRLSTTAFGHDRRYPFVGTSCQQVASIPVNHRIS